MVASASTTSAAVNICDWNGVFTMLDPDGAAVWNCSRPNGKTSNNYNTNVTDTLVLGNMLSNWGGTYGIPLSLVWNAAGFVGTTDAIWADRVLSQTDAAGFARSRLRMVPTSIPLSNT